MSNKFMTVIYDVSQPEMKEKAKKLLAAADWTAAGWSHAFADRDEARAALYKLQESSSAAPQVVAEGWELPVATWFAIDHADGVQFHPSEEQALRYSESGQCVKYFSEDQMRAALQAAPVRAQELSDATIINAANKYGISPHAAMPFVRELIAAQSTTQEIRAVANPVEFDGIKTDAVQAQEPVAHLKFWAAQSWSGNGNHDIDCGEGLEVCEAGEIGADKLPAFPVYRAPVQPVAVPEALRLLSILFDSWENGTECQESFDGASIGNAFKLSDEDFHACVKVLKGTPRAAPAAQGDLRNAISNAIYSQGDMLEDHNGTVEAIYAAIVAKAAS